MMMIWRMTHHTKMVKNQRPSREAKHKWTAMTKIMPMMRTTRAALGVQPRGIRRRVRKKNVTLVHLEKYGIELPESTNKLIEKSPEKYICCANGHQMRAGPFVDTNKRSKTAGKQKNLNNTSKTKPAADDGSNLLANTTATTKRKK